MLALYCKHHYQIGTDKSKHPKPMDTYNYLYQNIGDFKKIKEVNKTVRNYLVGSVKGSDLDSGLGNGLKANVNEDELFELIRNTSSEILQKNE